jgi:hypothetical protein
MRLSFAKSRWTTRHPRPLVSAGVLGADTSRRLVVDETGWQTDGSPGGDNMQSSIMQAVFHRIDDADSPLPLHEQVDLLLFHTDVWVNHDKYGWTVVTSAGYEPKPVLCNIAALIGGLPCEPIVAQP